MSCHSASVIRDGSSQMHLRSTLPPEANQTGSLQRSSRRRSGGLGASLIHTQVSSDGQRHTRRNAAAPTSTAGQLSRQQHQPHQLPHHREFQLLTQEAEARSLGSRSAARLHGSDNTVEDTMEEYKLDDRELAALERLYDYPARSALGSSSRVQAVNIIDTLSQVARTSEARCLGQQPAPSVVSVASAASSRKRVVKRQHAVAAPSAAPPAPPMARQDIIAKLLEEAARSPPPPIPTRRPDIGTLKMRGGGSGDGGAHARGRLLPAPPVAPPASRTPPPTGSRRSPAWRERTAPDHDRQHSLDGLYERSPSSRSAQDRSTPDWIGHIFQLAKSGNIAGLSSALADMEPAMVRNLTDHHGNNLTHVLSACGHVEALAWMLKTCGHAVAEALLDRNKHGLTPSTAAIRFGRLDVVRWLVENTDVRDRLFARDGERSLLHIASKYGQLELVAWCAEQLAKEQRGLDSADHRLETALHLAAKTGNQLVAQTLLSRGASVTARNDMGMKPYDLAEHFEHSGCAEFLLTFEAFSDLSVDFTSLQAETVRLQQENADYKNNFREVLSVARKLLREREDMCKELGRLHDGTEQLQDHLFGQLRQLATDNDQLRRQLQLPPTAAAGGDLSGAEEMTGQLHARWQHCQRTWFSAQLADAQHRVIQAEQVWQRLRAGARKDGASVFTAGADEIVRNKISDLRAQSVQMNLTNARGISSSDTSLVDSELYQQIAPPPDGRKRNHHASDIYGSHRQHRQWIGPPEPGPGDRQQPGDNETLPHRHQTPLTDGTDYRRSSMRNDREERLVRSANRLDRLSVSARDSFGRGGLAHSLELSRSVDMLDVSVLNGNRSLQLSDDDILNSTFAGTASSRANGSGSGGLPEMAKAELRRQLRGLALVSESGSASVLEVIEPPAGDESASSGAELVQREIEAQRRARQTRSRESSRARNGASQAAKAASEVETARARNHGSATQHDQTDFLGLRTGKPHRPRTSEKPECSAVLTSTSASVAGVSWPVSAATCRVGEVDRGATRAAYNPAQRLSEPDILQGTKLSNETHLEPTSAPWDSVNMVSADLNRSLTELDSGPESVSGSGRRRRFLQRFGLSGGRRRDDSERRAMDVVQSTAVQTSQQRAAFTAVEDQLAVHWSSPAGETELDRMQSTSEGADTSSSNDAADSGHSSKSITSTASGHSSKCTTSITSGHSSKCITSITSGHSSKCITSITSRTRNDEQNANSMPEQDVDVGRTDSPVGSTETHNEPPPLPLMPPPDSSLPTRPPVAPKPHTLPRRLPSSTLPTTNTATTAYEDERQSRAGASRSGSSASLTFPPYTDYPASTGHADGTPPGRLSPTPSEASKTESALSPPSQTSDLSRTESTRHLNQLDKIEEQRVETSAARLRGAETNAGSATHPTPIVVNKIKLLPLKTEKRSNERRIARRSDRPWYEVSDDESDLLQTPSSN